MVFDYWLEYDVCAKNHDRNKISANSSNVFLSFDLSDYFSPPMINWKYYRTNLSYWIASIIQTLIAKDIVQIKKDYTEYVTLDNHLWNRCILLLIYNFDISLLGSIHLLANPVVDRCSSISLLILRSGFDSIMLGVLLLEF